MRFHVRPAGCGSVAVERVEESGDVVNSSTLPSWDAVLWRGRLYVHVGARQLCDGSKEAFVALLELAEDKLNCAHVVVCLPRKIATGTDNKNRKDEDNNRRAVKNFLFLGFRPLAPGHEFLPPNDENLVCFVYTI